MQSVSSRIWTRVVVSISYDDNRYTTGTSYCQEFMIITDQVPLIGLIKEDLNSQVIAPFQQLEEDWKINRKKMIITESVSEYVFRNSSIIKEEIMLRVQPGGMRPDNT